MIFAAASPIAAVVTYVALRGLLGGSGDAAVALCVLFSGGTFLYAAAVHMMPDVHAMRAPEHAAFLAGAFVPVALSSLSGHHH